VDSIALNDKPRDHWKKLLVITTLLFGFATHADADDKRWALLKATYFGDRHISTDSRVILIETAAMAFEATAVPILIRTANPPSQIRQLHLIADMNPLPLAGVFKFSDQASNWESLVTHIKINEYTDVRAIAELADGSLHMASFFVETARGCATPPMDDMKVAITRAGEMDLRLDTGNSGTSSRLEAVIKVSHPNSSGMQYDLVSKSFIPAFFVKNIKAELNGHPLVEVKTNFTMSENPVLRFNFVPTVNPTQSPMQMLVYALDSKGNRYEQSTKLDEKKLSQ